MSVEKTNKLNEIKTIAHFHTTRQGGVSMGNYASNNLSPYTGDNSQHQKENLFRLAKQLLTKPEKIIFPFQIHGTEVKKIDNSFLSMTQSQKLDFLQGIDALVTDQIGLCIGVTTADCVPLIFYDTEKHVSGVAHAGWRGTCGQIALKTIEVMVKSYGTKPKNLLVSIGPSISPDVYEVGSELVAEFSKMNFPVDDIFQKKDEKLFLNLWEANRWLLIRAGVPESQIEITGECTFTLHEKYFSARRLGIKSGRILSGIMLYKRKNYGD
ncbi:MAG: peptidoglycan editing factor PgeF [Paludibacter sp.]|nr:peptidoglycan editing factor PgeF [Paludibacter sp.]